MTGEAPSKVQDLSSFRLPRNFRGRSAIVVQLWWAVQATAFRCSPQVLYGFRRWLLRLFGARVGKGVRIRPSATVTYPWKVTVGDYTWIGDDVIVYSLGEICIGNNTVISQSCYLCAATHDYRSRSFDMHDRKIVIDDEVWVSADVFVAPGVTIGKGAVVGARSSVFKDLPPMMVSVGSPAQPMRPRI
jgi:putative colanic acid biosynthesis acetyltransferase WcaF